MHELVFELSGPYYELAWAEIRGVMEGNGHGCRTVSYQEGLLIVETDAPPEVLCGKLGLTHRILYHLGTTDRERLMAGDTGIKLPPGSAAVVTRRIGGREVDSMEINRGFGGEISRDNPIDLERPVHSVIVLVSESCVVGRLACVVDKKGMSRRLVKNRPYFSPVSLEPKYARALVNMARPAKGLTIHDPFCGTGGILLEAAEMGYKVSGGDTDPMMVEGCRRNLRTYNLQGNVWEGDVSQNIPEGIDRIVTDPPYGRSSSSRGEDIRTVYSRLLLTASERLGDKGYLAVIFPGKRYYRLGSEYLSPVEMHRTRVHSSLERYFCLFRKE